MTSTLTKPQLRKQAISARRALDAEAQLRARERICDVLIGHRAIRNAARIATYIADDGEVDLSLAMNTICAFPKRVYVPAIYPGRRNFCRFAEWTPHTPMELGKFNIPTPVNGFARGVTPLVIDVVLMPLVAVDRHGNRLGRGGGFYDRTMGYLLQRKAWNRPKLIGIAHECQRVERIPSDVWDVPIDDVIVV